MGEQVGGLADTLTDRDAAGRIVAWINTAYDNPETNRDYRVALRVFGKRLAEGDPNVDRSAYDLVSTIVDKVGNAIHSSASNW